MTMLEPRLGDIPVPRTSAEAAEYWVGIRAGELRYQRCTACGRANFGPGLVCRACQSTSLEWRVSKGLGEVYSWTVVWRPQTPAFEVPYAPAIIRMDDGYDMISALVGLDHTAITAGLRVAVEFHAVTDEFSLPFFRPIG